MKKQFCRKEFEAGTTFEISNEENLVQCGIDSVENWYYIIFNGVKVGVWYSWDFFALNLDKLLDKYGMQDCEPIGN